MDLDIKRYIKREFYKGKSLPARFIDTIFLKIMIFLGLFIAFFMFGYGALRSIVLSAAITGTTSIFKFVFLRAKFSLYAQKRIQQAKKECILEKLILADNKTKHDIYKTILTNYLNIDASDIILRLGGYVYGSFFCYFFKNHPKYPVNVEQLSEVCRKMKKVNTEQLILFSTSGFDTDARIMAVRRSNTCEFIERDELIELIGETSLCPSEEEIYYFLSAEASEKKLTKKKLIDSFINADKGKAFALLALVLAIWPIVGEFNIAYPIASAFCGMLAAYCFIKSWKSK